MNQKELLSALDIMNKAPHFVRLPSLLLFEIDWKVRVERASNDQKKTKVFHVESQL